VLYTLGGSVFLLIALLALFDAAPDAGFAMSGLAATARGLPEQTQILLLLAFLAGFGVKMPVFPLHGWLPLAHVQAPAPISILLSGILLKLGSYGLLRAAAMLPDAARALQDPLLALALIGLLYGGLLAWRQTDLKAMVAYSSISHMGVVLLGIATLDTTGLTGAVTQMVAHGLVAASLFLLFGLLYQRTHSRDLGHYGSLLAVAPRFTVFLVLAFVAAVGLPGSAGFVAELHTLIGGFLTWGWWVLGLAAGMLISAAYALRCVGWLCTGPLRGSLRGLPDLARGELLAAALLAVGTFWLGWFPGPLLGLTGPTLTQLAAGFGGG
jgi:NADH-quinone oxidoreductase subunit M